MSQITRTISNHEITLDPGKRYQAHRPIANHGDIDRQRFTISISELSTGDHVHYANSILGGRNTVTEIPNLTYDEANKFLNEFNNGVTSLEGRVW